MPSWFYRNEDEFREDFERLNAVTSEPLWQPTKARKEHEDLFGVRIASGEIYYKRRVGSAWDAAIRLSRQSIERLLYALLQANPLLQELADEIHEARLERLREMHARYSPLRTLMEDVNDLD